MYMYVYTYLVAISYFLFLLFIAAMAQLFVQYSRHVLRHWHWTMPSPHCTVYVEFNEGDIMEYGEREPRELPSRQMMREGRLS